MKLNRTALAAATLLSATVLGASVGSTAALWHDAGSTTGQISTGTVAFQLTSPADTVPGDSEITLGSDTFAQLVESGAVAIPVTTDIQLTGAGGFTFDVALNGSGNIWDFAKVISFAVDDPAGCTVEAAATATPVPIAGGVDAGLDGTRAVSQTDTWCTVATLPTSDGQYRNVGSAAGRSGGSTVTSQTGAVSSKPDDGSAVWSTDVTHPYDVGGQLPVSTTTKTSTVTPPHGDAATCPVG